MTSLESEFATNPQPEDPYAAPALDVEDYAEHTAQMLARALENTGLIEVAEVRANAGQAHLMGRVRQDREKTFLAQVVKPLLRVMETNCKGFVGRQYLLRNDELRFGWVISFSSNNLKETAHLLCQALEPAIPVKVEVTEAPLVGTGTPQSGGLRTGKKGAAPVGAGVG